eukprot:CAMPEP_0113666416 /NCGR_PEP_ID=MMETSP0038_2-20120614/2860_1 /TAXON_ID=2898 /ORGANISM="Cryptomonas paramecium" /LENGTH=149 /DNA_ID=CAMNT_0000581901 /DNA_START=102 /DNA_END=548 /DNA_ORIENTATION=+ /assembly_acc=CAM_ASM_000170
MGAAESCEVSQGGDCTNQTNLFDCCTQSKDDPQRMLVQHALTPRVSLRGIPKEPHGSVRSDTIEQIRGNRTENSWSLAKTRRIVHVSSKEVRHNAAGRSSDAAHEEGLTNPPPSDRQPLGDVSAAVNIHRPSIPSSSLATAASCSSVAA